jgi:hypothetical protein
VPSGVRTVTNPTIRSLFEARQKEVVEVGRMLIGLLKKLRPAEA